MRKAKTFQNVLLIDDDVITNTINQRLLLSHGFADNVTSVTSVTKAIRYLERLHITGSYVGEAIDLILLDLKMEGKDGFWFLKQYHTKQGLAKAHLVVALTSSASFYDLEKLKAFPDVAKHLFKPLNSTHLAELADMLDEVTA